MNSSLDRLAAIHCRISDTIQRNVAASEASAAGKVSRFWREIFDGRKNFPDLNEIMVFRREGFTYGIGDGRQGGVEQEREHSKRMHHIFRQMVDTKFVAGIPESAFGAPYVFEHDGVARSTSFWINAATTRRVVEFVARYGKRGPLRVLEIGAGWGACAYQLHHALDVQNYMIVDLPNNLHISSVYLSTVLPERPLELLDVSGPDLTELPVGTITGCLPGTVSRIRGKFDLVLNSFSLQEMDLDTVQAYINWVGECLSDDGIFVSLNSHGKAGVTLPSDYGWSKFHIHHWGAFRTSPSGFLNTIPYEVVVSRRRPDSPEYPADVQNGLGGLMQLGLDRDLEDHCSRFVTGSLGDDERRMLCDYARLFAAESEDKRSDIVSQLQSRDPSPVWPYIRAHIALVKEEHAAWAGYLAEACQRGLSGFARVRANVMLAARARADNRAPPMISINGFDPTFAYPEVARMVETGDVSPMLSQTKRVFGYP